MTSKECCSMVVVECGARLPDERRPRHPTHLLVRQRETESPGSLLARIRGELSYLDANARGVDDALISCGRSIERGACEARERLTAEVLDRLRNSPHARLVLFAEADVDATLRTELASLAERARAVLAKTGGSVTVSFGELVPRNCDRTQCTSRRSTCAAFRERARSVE